MSRRERPHVYYDVAVSLCPTCLRKVEGKIVFEHERVWLIGERLDCRGRSLGRVVRDQQFLVAACRRRKDGFGGVVPCHVAHLPHFESLPTR